ncbi:YcgL domain-containing protein [Thalassotalea castellviae]|uniref:YcgL domain-containing protein RM573_13225 n=1 Tax=Thalassotalea castellviae TaxID=3075612 RepID=A0ABU3A446_9GAMM|nr:YcgL domain-containing protein [Thalassotalea sp. W431]MDT0604565.1 YcgL domain-containing protein [Thalassotalea sp. W431]
MLCVIYKSPKKAQTYLFIKQRDKFEDVPEALMAMFGTPTLVTIINLDNKDKLALADINKVRENLNNQGFYLQLPPPQEDLLKEHKEQMKLKSQQV